MVGLITTLYSLLTVTFNPVKVFQIWRCFEVLHSTLIPNSKNDWIFEDSFQFIRFKQYTGWVAHNGLIQNCKLKNMFLSYRRLWNVKVRLSCFFGPQHISNTAAWCAQYKNLNEQRAAISTWDCSVHLLYKFCINFILWCLPVHVFQSYVQGVLHVCKTCLIISLYKLECIKKNICIRFNKNIPDNHVYYWPQCKRLS